MELTRISVLYVCVGVCGCTCFLFKIEIHSQIQIVLVDTSSASTCAPRIASTQRSAHSKQDRREQNETFSIRARSPPLPPPPRFVSLSTCTEKSSNDLNIGECYLLLAFQKFSIHFYDHSANINNSFTCNEKSRIGNNYKTN